MSVPYAKTNLASNGTGFLIGDDGVFITCRHILHDSTSVNGSWYFTDTAQITVKFHNGGRAFPAILLKERLDKDIAILKVMISKPEFALLKLRSIKLGKSKEIRDGCDVASTGYDLLQKSERLGREYTWLTTHKGIISSSRWEQVDSVNSVISSFQSDIVVNGGASGSPVYDPNTGMVLGMISSFQVSLKHGTAMNAGIANCIPTAYLASLIWDWANEELERQRVKSNKEK